MDGTTPIAPSVELMPVRMRSGLPIFLTACARISEVAAASEPWIASSLTCTPAWAPICSAFLMASAALSGPTVSTVTVLSPASGPSARLRADSMAYSSSSESRPSTPNRSVVLSDSLNVGSDVASGTYFTQTTMFTLARPLS